MREWCRPWPASRSLSSRQVQAGAEVLAFAVDHRGAHGGGHFFEQVAQGQDQAVVQGVALGAAGQADDGNFLLVAGEFEMDVWMGHGGFRVELNYGYKS